MPRITQEALVVAMHEVYALSARREVAQEMATLWGGDPGNGLVDVLVGNPRLWPMNRGIVEERLERGGVCSCVGGGERKKSFNNGVWRRSLHLETNGLIPDVLELLL